jgi:hypothetical protein
VLAEWVPEEELREQWQQHLHYRAPEPAGPPGIRPLVFRGVSEAGSVVEVRDRGEEFGVEVDGALVERVSDEGFGLEVGPTSRFYLDRVAFDETFDASEEALHALEDFTGAGGPPPWEHAAELLGDGLIETHLALTARGRRALARRSA